MRYLSPIALFLLIGGAQVGSDQGQPPPVPPVEVVALDRTEPVSYEKEVEPILAAKCFVCHSGNVIEGKLDMSTFERLLKGGKHGQVIVPGKSAESLLVKLAGRTERPIMPPRNETDEPLSPRELALIKLWIDEGAKAPAGATNRRPRVIVGTPPALVQPVRAVAVRADKKAVAAGRGNQIHVFDPNTGNHFRALVNPDLKTSDGQAVQAAHLSIVESLTYSPDGKLLISGSFQEVIIWDAETGTPNKKLGGFADRVVALAVSRDGKYLAAGGGAPAEEGEIKVFELESGDLVADIKNGHSDTVFGVCFSPDGTKLATCAADKFVKVFEVPGGKLLRSFEGHTHHVLDVGWKGDGRLLASAGVDNVVKIWDYQKGEQVRTIDRAHGKQITRLVFIGTTPQFITCSGDQSVKVWNVDNGSPVRNYPPVKDYLYAVGVSPDGALVATGGEEGVVRLYNGGDAKLLRSLTPP